VIDLYYQHRSTDSIGHGRRMKRLVEQGKVRYLGLCEAHRAVRRATGHPISALQERFSVAYASRPSDAPHAAELGIRSWPTRRSGAAGSSARQSLATSGGRSAARSPALPRVHFARTRPGRRIEPDREGEGLHPAQLALAWLLGRAGHRPIPGTETEGAGSRKLRRFAVRLDAGDAERIAGVIRTGAAAGTRYRGADEGSHLVPVPELFVGLTGPAARVRAPLRLGSSSALRPLR